MKYIVYDLAGYYSFIDNDTISTITRRNMDNLTGQESLNELLEQIIDNDPALKRTLDLFEITQENYKNAVQAMTSTINYTNDTSNPQGESNGVLD